MKKIILLLLFPLVVSGQTTLPEYELLWEISGKNLKKPSYLFGTYHSNDRRLFNFPDSVYVAMHNAERIALEADLFDLFEKLTTLQEDAIIRYDNRGIPFSPSDKASKTLFGDESGMPQFMDAYFQQYCYNSGKEFVALDPLDEANTKATSLKLSELARVKVESLLTAQEDLITTYCDGDIYKLDDLLKLNLSIYPGLHDQLILERNKAIVDNLTATLSDKSVFVAINAAHLPGANGLIMALRKKGYKVRRIAASFEKQTNPAKHAVKSTPNFQYVNDSLGLIAYFPGLPKVIEPSGIDGFEFKLLYRDYGQGNTYVVEVYANKDSLDLSQLAELFIPSPIESPFSRIILDNGDEVYEGIADAYPEGIYWVRVIRSEDHFIVAKTYGGNRYMNSNRPAKFFEQIWFE